MAVAHSRGLLDYDEKIATYWPEFAPEGKEKITVKQLLSHQAGLCMIEEALDLDVLADPCRTAESTREAEACLEVGNKPRLLPLRSRVVPE